MPKKLYDIFTWIKIGIGILIPLFVGLNEVWNFSWGYQVIQSLTLIEAAIIAVLKVDSVSYFKDKDIIPRDE